MTEDRIAELEDKLARERELLEEAREDAQEARAQVDEAIQDLPAAEAAYRRGDADTEEVEAARKAVEEAKKAVKAASSGMEGHAEKVRALEAELEEVRLVPLQRQRAGKLGALRKTAREVEETTHALAAEVGKLMKLAGDVYRLDRQIGDGETVRQRPVRLALAGRIFDALTPHLSPDVPRPDPQYRGRTLPALLGFEDEEEGEA